LSVTAAISEAQNNIVNQRSLELWNPHGIGLFLYSGALPNTPTRSPKTPETRINKGKKQRKQDSSRGARGWAGGHGWMRVCAGFVRRVIAGR